MKTTCCIVGAGPAGMMLAYLLVRQGVEVTLIEAQKDFDREFRGDTLHPSIMENMEELGLVDELLQIPHVKAKEGQVQTQEGNVRVMDFSVLKTKYPYITLMPQDKFLDFMARKARVFPSFTLMMETEAIGLSQSKGKVVAVKVQTPGGKKKIFADLVVAADGRFSKLRDLAGIEMKKTAAPMDVMWFKLPKRKADSCGENALVGHVMPGYIAAQLDRGKYWQFGGVVPKGLIQQLHHKGVKAFQDRMIKLLPDGFTKRLRQLKDWKAFGNFVISCGRVQKWYKPGLLLIGDAAHIMSPVGGVGINYAIQDAIVAANLLAKPLLAGDLNVSDLAKVQKKRLWPTRVIQWFQGFAHRFIIKQALRPDKPLKVPFIVKIPGVRRLVTRFIAFGWWRVRVGGLRR